jgi:hypothetical protein
MKHYLKKEKDVEVIAASTLLLLLVVVVSSAAAAGFFFLIIHSNTCISLHSWNADLCYCHHKT